MSCSRYLSISCHEPFLSLHPFFQFFFVIFELNPCGNKAKHVGCPCDTVNIIFPLNTFVWLDGCGMIWGSLMNGALVWCIISALPSNKDELCFHCLATEYSTSTRPPRQRFINNVFFSIPLNTKNSKLFSSHSETALSVPKTKISEKELQWKMSPLFVVQNTSESHWKLNFSTFVAKRKEVLFLKTIKYAVVKVCGTK